jgi:membrane-bound ClpP family serine protease
MCHLILLLPLIGLAVFWIAPLSIAIPIYVVVLLASGFWYYSIMKSMRRPVVTGREGLIGQRVEIIDMSGRTGHVRTHGEIWRAVSDDIFHGGDKAIILDIEDLTLRIARESSAENQPKPEGYHS